MMQSKPYMIAVDYTAKDAPEKFADSLRETGFAVLMNHPISLDEINAFYDEWAQFFSSDDKYQYLFDKEKQDGFFPTTVSEVAKGYNVKDLKEYYHYFSWGRFPSYMSGRTAKLRDDLAKLASTLLQWIEAALPDELKQKLSMPLSEMSVNSERTLLRILHYPPLVGNEEEGAIRAAAHEDINLITLLPMATTSGLQVLDTSGSWHDIPCESGMIAINSGDMLQECTGRYFPSTTHRVVNPSGEASRTSRYSVPLFLHPREEVRLSERYTAREYWLERLAELGVL
jgi:isopenicillin N synthase-like dioxygenase